MQFQADNNTSMARATHQSLVAARARRNAAAAATRANNRARDALAARIAVPALALAQFPALPVDMATAPAPAPAPATALVAPLFLERLSASDIFYLLN